MKMFDSTSSSNKWLYIAIFVIFLSLLVHLTYRITYDYAYNKTITNYLDSQNK